MRAIVLGIFTGGILRTVFGMAALNSTSLNVPRVLFGLLAGVMVMLVVGGIVGLLNSSGKTEDIFEEKDPPDTANPRHLSINSVIH